MTDPAALAVIVSIVAVAGQAANVYLNLKTSKAILESERRILDRVGCEYASREACSLQMKELARRVGELEHRRYHPLRPEEQSA